jgi:hypothetical protein
MLTEFCRDNECPAASGRISSTSTTGRQTTAPFPIWVGLLFDETDHLGACFAKNRFDMDSSEQLKEADQVTWDGFSNKVDQHFEGGRGAPRSPPRPVALVGILEALDRLRPTNWLR